MRRGTQWMLLWLFCVCGWTLAIVYMIFDVRGGALDLF